MKNKFTVEWSEQQGCFHVDDATHRFANNGVNYLKRKLTEWTMLGIFDSHAEAHEFIRKLEERRADLYPEEVLK